MEETTTTRPMRGSLPTPSEPAEGGSESPRDAKTSRIHLGAGRCRLMPRDVQIAELLAAFGWLGVTPLAALLGNHSVQGVRKSLRRLATAGFVDDSICGLQGETLYRLTADGIRQWRLSLFSEATPRVGTVEEVEALAAICERTGRGGSERRVLMTGREVVAAAESGQLNSRIRALAPWTHAYSELEAWVPASVAPDGSVLTRQPDALMLRRSPDGAVLLPTPVLVELDVKTRPDAFRAPLMCFAHAADSGAFDSSIVVFSPSRCLVAVRDAMASTLHPGPKSQFQWPRTLQRPKIEFVNLDEVWLSAWDRSGWVSAQP